MVKGIVFFGIAILLAFVLWRGVKPGWSELSSDFSNYYVSSRLVLEDAPMDSLYNNDWFKKKGRVMGANSTEKFTPFPPITAFLALPLVWMSPLHAQRGLLVVNLILVFFCIRFIQKISGWEWHVCLLFMLLTGWGITNNIRLGQAYIFVLWLTLLSHIWVTQKKEWLTGAFTSTASALKYFNTVYVPAYWLAGNRKVVLSFLLSLLLLFLLQYLYFGGSVMNGFLHSTFLPHLDGRIDGQGPYHYRFQSWDGFLSFLLVADPDYNPNPWLSFPGAKLWIKYGIVLLVMGGTFIGMKRIRTFPEEWKLNGYIGLTGVAAFAILPATATYHFLLLVFPVLMLLLIPGLERTLKWTIVILYSGIGLIPYSLFEYLGNNWGVIFGFPRLWAVTLLFIVTLVAVMKNYRHVPAKE